MDIELKKLKKLEHAMCDAIDILRDWQVEEVKQECPCADGIDSKACVGCEHSEDGKRKYKPYVTVDEFIQDFQERFPTAVPRPAYTKPLIWVRLKVDKRERLIVTYGDNFVEIGNKTKTVTLQHLFEQYEFLDESPVGMEYAK